MKAVDGCWWSQRPAYYDAAEGVRFLAKQAAAMMDCEQAKARGLDIKGRKRQGLGLLFREGLRVEFGGLR
jgi:hypothetical protein